MTMSPPKNYWTKELLPFLSGKLKLANHELFIKIKPVFVGIPNTQQPEVHGIGDFNPRLLKHQTHVRRYIWLDPKNLPKKNDAIIIIPQSIIQQPHRQQSTIIKNRTLLVFSLIPPRLCQQKPPWRCLPCCEGPVCFGSVGCCGFGKSAPAALWIAFP